VTTTVREPEEPMAWALNRLEFEPEVTRRVRVVFRHSRPFASGVVEVRVFP
jgi:hypothetical protein